MNPGSSEWFLTTWARISRPAAGTLDGHPVPGAALAMFAAVDADARPHLLIEIPPGTALPRLRPVRALELRVDTLAVAGVTARPYIDVECTHAAHDGTFAALVAEIVRTVQASPAAPERTLAAVVDRWRAFWSVNAAGMSATDALGLFGELWFLDRWMTPLTDATLNSWNGPDRSRHDFQWARYSVEVKTSAAQASGGVTHRIVSLDQLSDPEQGELLLFSLSVSDDALARNTLPALVDRVRGTITDPMALEHFDLRLGAYGYNPAHASRYDRTLRVISESLYVVRPDFPRLIAGSFDGGLPAGVGRVSYELSMAACAPFRVATSPSEVAWTRARATLV